MFATLALMLRDIPSQVKITKTFPQILFIFPDADDINGAKLVSLLGNFLIQLHVHSQLTESIVISFLRLERHGINSTYGANDLSLFAWGNSRLTHHGDLSTQGGDHFPCMCLLFLLMYCHSHLIAKPRIDTSLETVDHDFAENFNLAHVS
jgi:hypothetical protein